MADTKKQQHRDNKSAKTSKDEMPRGNSSKSKSDNGEGKDDSKSEKKKSSSHSK